MVLLGDALGDALARVGVTPERVGRVLGRGCGGCKRRKDLLNALSLWAARVLAGRTEGAAERLDGIMEGEEFLPPKEHTS